MNLRQKNTEALKRKKTYTQQLSIVIKSRK